MPFDIRTFQQGVERWVDSGTARDELSAACEGYATAATRKRKASCIREMIEALDRAADAPARRAIMEACGRRCLGRTTLEKALRLRRHAGDLDELLHRLNAAGIGGGRLRREEGAVHAVYDRCYCGAVSSLRGSLSATYCLCSCGWLGRLFEAVLGRSVVVELLGSILGGDEACSFRVHIGGTDGTLGFDLDP